MRTLVASFTMILMALVLFVGPTTSSAAASETISCERAVEVVTSGHLPGDADEIPADGDQGTPHHHGLGHGHDIGVALTGHSPVVLELARATMRPWYAPTPSSVAPKSDLRPPIA